MSGVRVRRLHLRSTDAALAQAGRRMLGTALSDPSVDDGSPRLLLVRRLAPAAIRAGASAVAVQRWFGGALRELRAVALHGALPAAPYAPAVWFESRFEACLIAARRLAAGQRCEAWFWPLAIEGLQPALAPEAALRAALACAMREAPPALAAAAFLAALDSDRGAALATRALAREDATNLLRRCGWANAQPDAPHPGAAALRASLAGRALARPRPLLDAAAADWGAGDARTLWVGACLALLRAPQLAADPDLPAAVAIALSIAPGEPAGAGAQQAAPAHAACAAETGHPEPAHPVAARHGGAPLRVAASGPQRRGAGTDAAPQARPRLQAASAPRLAEAGAACARPERERSEYTGHAGLLFLLNPLRRLGFEHWLTRHPRLLAEDFPAALFAALARRCRIADEDPVLPRWLHAEHAATPWQADAWAKSLRLWCRRRAGIGLREVAQRPGAILLSPTHLDVHLEAHAIDMRLRRAGLDLDPGWVPWFGRVVRFHYASCEVCHEIG
jgi:hypothetical protein